MKLMSSNIIQSTVKEPHPAHARAGGFDVHTGFVMDSCDRQDTGAATWTRPMQSDSCSLSPNGSSPICCNQQYSITAVTTSAGAVTERYAYTAYGLPTILDASASVLSSSAISNRYTYTGREWDATLALHHFRARWMSPIAGRFVSRDPLRYLDGPNFYNALRGKPFRFIDYTGFYTYTPDEVDTCLRKLKSYTPEGGIAGNVHNCAGELLQIFLDGSSNDSGNCPAICERRLNDSLMPGGKLNDIILPRLRADGKRNSSCSGSYSFTENYSGHDDFDKGDLYYAFHGFDYNFAISCGGSCGEKRGGMFGCYPCCFCNGDCTVTGNITDGYNFCGSTHGDKFSLTNCGCALQRAGKGKIFDVNCPVNKNRKFSWLNCDK